MDVLTELSSDEAWQVRSLVAENPRTPVKTLAALSTDTDEYVREEALSTATPLIAEYRSNNPEDDVAPDEIILQFIVLHGTGRVELPV